MVTAHNIVVYPGLDANFGTSFQEMSRKTANIIPENDNIVPKMAILLPKMGLTRNIVLVNDHIPPKNDDIFPKMTMLRWRATILLV